MQPTLRINCRGPHVARLQNILNTTLKPSPSLIADGIFGPKTELSENDLINDGIARVELFSFIKANHEWMFSRAYLEE